MRKVKFFNSTDAPSSLTNRVNKWLEENSEINIINIKHKVSGRLNTTTVVMIDYEVPDTQNIEP